jgi:hypothetical protein
VVKRGTAKFRKLVKSDRFQPIEKELYKQTKAELAVLIMAIARKHSDVVRELEDRLSIEIPVDLIVTEMTSAIDRATNFDERQINHNFEVDWEAYADVREGLLLLVQLNRLEEAKSLALKLMADGSHQVESSDEGLMTREISECLMPVIRAVRAAGGEEAVKWAGKMQVADRIGFICDRELAELRDGT